jgi:hypothetical protein
VRQQKCSPDEEIVAVSQRSVIFLMAATAAALAAGAAAEQPASAPTAAGGQQARTYTLQVNAQEIVLDLVVTDVKANPLPTSSETIFRSMRSSRLKFAL